MPNSLNKRPVLPGSSDSGMKTAINTSVVEITAKPIWRAPRTAASSGGSPSSMWRWMFSSTTMASSTTRPIASTNASSVSTFSEKPNAARIMNEATIDTGMAMVGISVARKERRKKKMTPTTRASAMPSAWNTSWIDWAMKVEVSNDTSSARPAGSVVRISAIMSLAPSATSSVFAFDCLTMPRPIARLPLLRTSPRASSGPSSTLATSPRRTGKPSLTASTMFRNWSGVFMLVSVRTVNSRIVDSTRPAGSSTFCLRSAPSTSWTVSSRAASSRRSSQTRME